jgi:hypothetical protein
LQGRGELQIGILVETLRREGYEMTVSPPKVTLDIPLLPCGVKPYRYRYCYPSLILLSTLTLTVPRPRYPSILHCFLVVLNLTITVTVILLLSFS